MTRVDAIAEATEILNVAGSGVRWSDPTGEIYEITGNLTAEQITEIEATADTVLAEYDALQYQRDREPDYPNLAEQFDLLWHAIDADTLDKTSDFYTTLKAVKDAHPKG